MLADADQAFDIGFRYQLQHGLCNSAQKVAAVLLGQKFGRSIMVLVIGVLCGSWLKRRNSTRPNTSMATQHYTD